MSENPKNNGGRKGVVLTILILLLVIGGFFAYKVLLEEKGGRELKTGMPADSLKTVAGNDTLGNVDPADHSEARILGFAKGIECVECSIEKNYGYLYYFGREGQINAVYSYHNGTNSTVTIVNGKAVKCETLDGPAEELENPPVAEEYNYVFEYRQAGDSAEVYSKLEGESAVKIGAYYYDENGRITRATDSWRTWQFTYDAEGKAVDQNGQEVYPPIVIFFEETPILPKKFKAQKTDSLGRVTEAVDYNGRIHYTIRYFE